MASKKNISSARKGMQRDKYPSELTKDEYSFAMNSNYQDENGNGIKLHQNEPSNIKCSGFKVGYRVIGHKYDISADRTYFFLTNPTTKCSEIGYIESFQEADSVEVVESECNCRIQVTYETPLEKIVQQSTCDYITIITDSCDEEDDCSNACLKFDIQYPIRENNVHIKNERGTKVMYFTDGKNPQRYIQLDNIEQYYQDVDDCTDEVVDTCLNCEKMRIFKMFDKPCLQPRVIQNGGTLRAGVYEVIVAYSTFEGKEISDYYSITNPISIFDPNNKVLDQTTLDYITGQAVAIDVSGIDTDYDYYKIVVIYTSALDQSVTYREYGTYPTDQKSFTISSLENKLRLEDTQTGDSALKTLLKRRPTYETAKGLASGNNYLFHYGLTAKEEINLQPVVNLLGAFVRWTTVQAYESLYEDGVNVSKFTAFMRDEVYGLSIKFFQRGGRELPLFPFIARPPKEEELYELGQTYETTPPIPFPEDYNTQSIAANAPPCSENIRNKYWQYYNTATVLGDCVVPGYIGTETAERQTQSKCTATEENGTPTVVDSINDSSIELITDLDLITYINNNRQLIISSVGPNGADIRNILSNPNGYDAPCDPRFGNNCDLPATYIEGEIFAISVETELKTVQYGSYGQYTRPLKPSTCSIYKLDTNGDPEYDTAFINTYMEPTDVAYVRAYDLPNTTCLSALNVPYLESPQIDNSVYFRKMAQLTTFETLQTPLVASKTEVFMEGGSNFILTNKVHANALWYKLNFNGEDRAIFEVSPNSCEFPETNRSVKVRVNVFLDCSATSDMPAYSRIIDDITLLNDSDKFFTFLASDFGGVNSSVYIAIDIPIGIRNLSGDRLSYTLIPTCGCFNVFTQVLLKTFLVNYTELKFGKKNTYEATCTYSIPDLKNCTAAPHKYGLFSYWESELTYECNKELYDSSELDIAPDDIPEDIRGEFEDYFVDTVGPTYTLNSSTDFRDKPIRHYKFPSSQQVPFISEEGQYNGPFKNSRIYPIGFTLSNDHINAFLDIAVKNGLLTLSDRLDIVSYEIFRSDRRTDRSIIAKGLLYDVYRYLDENNNTINYPNYPLNTLGYDNLNLVQHPFSSLQNNRFTFHSPETHFNKPILPRELTVEGYMYGASGTYSDEVSGHSTYIILTNKGEDLIKNLATAEAVLELALKIIDFGFRALEGGALTAPIGAGLAIGAGVALGIGFFIRRFELITKWNTVITNLGVPQNFAYYNVSLGYYSYFKPNSVFTSRIRGIASSNYIGPGNVSLTNEVDSESLRINNIDRESSVFLNLGTDAVNYSKITYPPEYPIYDNTDSLNSSRSLYSGKGRSSRIDSNVASPYASIKQYSPAQYGDITSIEWINTGYCGDLGSMNECEGIFGGDTYISRFSLKRKLPFFTSNAVNLAPLIPFKYSNYFNINPTSKIGRYYIDYLTRESEFSLNSIFFPEQKTDSNLYSPSDTEKVYYRPPSKFFLFSYGIPYFLVETEINTNYRYAKREQFEDFYPNVGDIIDWTQEKNVSIKQPNTYFYNPVYSKAHTTSPWRLLPTNYSKELYKKLENLDNTVIYSVQDNSETQITDPWLIYKPLDMYNFPTNYGKLIEMDNIESEQILGRFENGITMFAAIDVLRDRLTPETSGLGSGGIFSGRNINFNRTDLGYGGTQHSLKISCEYGHFWVDARRGEVFQLMPNGQGLNKITQGCEKWFKENLPFKIVGKVEGLTDLDVDNAFNGPGITMGWDARLKRVFITKKDYNVIADGINYRKDIGFYVLVDNVLTVIELTNSAYFKECSFTIAYSPKEEDRCWIAYYSFKPNYYITYNQYFQTGLNVIDNNEQFGLWSHLPFISSYQVFYGVKYPWIVEYPMPTQLVDSVINNVEYWMDTRKYYNKHDFSDVTGVGMSKAIIYNNSQNTGVLDLVSQDKNSLRQLIMYPKFNAESIEILQTETSGRWAFDYLYNAVKQESRGIPIWKYDCNQVNKELDIRSLEYKNKYKDRMRGDYFLVRLINDAETRFKMILRYTTDEREYYEQ